MSKIKICLIIIILLNFSSFAFGKIIEIKIKIRDNIITNIDIENEKKYLIFLNPKLKELKNQRLENIAKDSLITEIIKKTELEKYFDFNKNLNLIERVEKNLLKRKNIKNSEDFKKVLKKQGIKYQTIKKKLYVETLWNQLIYQKFRNNIVIDKVGLKKNIQDKFKNKEEKFIYNLSEIVFSESINENSDQIFKKINRSIKNIGFENSANIFSISNTNKNGGMIGWINEIQISEQINNEIKNLNINEITRPIKINNGFILIKVNDKKLFKEQINIDEELSKLVNKETNRQLSTFSTIYYKKLKKNIEINEY